MPGGIVIESKTKVSPTISNVMVFLLEFLMYPLYSVKPFEQLTINREIRIIERLILNFIFSLVYGYLNPSLTPSPKREKSYFIGSSGQIIFSFLVISSTAFQSFCFLFSIPNALPTLLVWISKGK